MAVFTIHTVPDDTKRLFKKACAQNSVSMAKVTVDFMLDYISETLTSPIENNEETTIEEELIHGSEE